MPSKFCQRIRRFALFSSTSSAASCDVTSLPRCVCDVFVCDCVACTPCDRVHTPQHSQQRRHAQGVLEAAQSINLQIPVVMRLEGTRVEEAKALIAVAL
jgi:hypothetical protein